MSAALKAKTIVSGIFGDLASASSTIPFEMSFTISVQSGWPLKGVPYESTSTLLEEVSRFLEGIWSQICGGIGLIAGGISKAFSFLQTMFSTLLSYAVKVVEFLANVLQTMVSAIQDFFFKGAATVVGWIAEGVSALLGTVRFNLTIFGLSFSIQTNVADLALGSTKDVLRITFSLCALGATLSISTRILRLGAGDFDIIANATLSTDAWAVSVVIDPLMRVFRHFVEIKGVFGNRAFELNVPEVVQYERLKLSLAEAPGIGAFLTRIPLPFPGLVGSVDAGFELKYNLPFANHLVINEYEQNPPGSDYGREWVEIYNPTETVQSVAGWAIETSHGAQRLEPLGDRVIQPRSHLVFVMEGQALDNGGEIKFPLMECIVLRNQAGERVDSTPWTTDYYNDGRTWQRVSDGADRWVFKEETAGRHNGKRASSNTEFDWLRKAVLDAAASAFAEVSDVTVNMDALGKLVKKAVEKLVENCIKALADSIVEMRVYVEVAVQDYSSSARAGFTISLVANGEFVEEAIAHLIRMVADAIGNMINPCHSGERVNSMESVIEDVYVQFGAFGEIGLPRMISRAGEGTSMRFDALVEANLPAVASLMGKELGDWRVTFGLRISEVPGSVLPTVLGVGADKLADIWIFRASVFET
ncbi:MAG: lamin tail domain-containing protein [Euryarchaeota archaeon]|nr:lamin tail domain-containing protein [Euryarchaeota archaeon]